MNKDMFIDRMNATAITGKLNLYSNWDLPLSAALKQLWKASGKIL
jgi:hypothetical protein